LLLTDVEDEGLVTQLETWTRSQELELVVRSSQDPEWRDFLSKEGITALVSVATREGPTIESLVAPHVLWVAVEEPDVSREDQTSTISRNHVREDQLGFLAGLLTGVATRNGRVGWLRDPNQVNMEWIAEGFLRGMRYVCTACRLTQFEPDALSLTTLRVNAVDALFVPLNPISEEILQILRDSALPSTIIDQPDLADVGLEILAEVNLVPTAPITKELNTLLESGGQRMPLLSVENGGIQLGFLNETLFSEGRIRVLNTALEQLDRGELQTGLEGEFKGSP
jgi:hypothetical protein